MKIRRFIKRFVSFIKRDPKEYVALICAACIMAISFLTASYPAFAAATSWDDVSADAIALKNAYIDYFKSLSSGDFGDVLGSAVDIPISWLKTMSDGALAISPVDDLYYYLKDGVLQYEDNREHRSGGGGGRRRGEATDIKPELPVSTVKQINDYWSEYYKPHENASQYIWSYQSNESDVGKDALYIFMPNIPVYVNNNWGNKKDWLGGVYVLPFFQDDDNTNGTLYSNRYAYFHTSGSTKEGNLRLVLDLFDLSSNNVVFSWSWDWNIATYPTASSYFQNLRTYCPLFFKSHADYLSKSSAFYVSGRGELDYGVFFGGKYARVGILENLLKTSSFTPNTNKNDDWGYIMSSEPFELYANQSQIDYDQIPDNYTITINGDTIYDYDITNPDTGDHGTVNYYITNNYTLPENGSKDDSKDDSGSGTVNGNVTVGGKVDVSGKIEIDTKPIDININVNGGGSGSSGSGTGESIGDYIDPGDVDTDIDKYLDKIPSVSKNFIDYLKDFFSWLPPDIYGLLILGLLVAIFCRISGR